MTVIYWRGMRNKKRWEIETKNLQITYIFFERARFKESGKSNIKFFINLYGSLITYNRDFIPRSYVLSCVDLL